ncbi:hypothetical protein N2152v2_003366 [Parachlorella kessleri]
MEARLRSHVLSLPSSSCCLRLSFRDRALAAPRPLRRHAIHRVPAAGLSLPLPQPTSFAAQSVGQILPGPSREGEEVLRVSTVHSPAELEAVVAANMDKLVVLMCKAKGCRPCKLFARKYARAADMYRDTVFLELFGDESKDTRALMVKMGIKVTPTFVLYRDGEKVHSHGGVNERNLHRAIQAHLLESEAGYGQSPAAAEDSDDD